ncbi:hypothetical protein F8M41_014850 [Gigaspora margarita]|uniref:Uncharacterized protein n=1 Tax=Gigaspora margarita TaxID=4874 RepID=A0A8H3WW75_GIGMA|nr:hypothetical protein F8M41_014850 [Gigaspora margarita]
MCVKKDLPNDPQLISKTNITIPIRLLRMLVEMNRELRKYYFFHKLPNNWIDIAKRKLEKDEKLVLSENINKINSVLENLLATEEMQVLVTEYRVVENIIKKTLQFQSNSNQLVEITKLTRTE